jgi:hypothetical protein
LKQVETSHYNPMREGLRVEKPNVVAFSLNPHSTLSLSGIERALAHVTGSLVGRFAIGAVSAWRASIVSDFRKSMTYWRFCLSEQIGNPICTGRLGNHFFPPPAGSLRGDHGR